MYSALRYFYEDTVQFSNPRFPKQFYIPKYRRVNVLWVVSFDVTRTRYKKNIVY